MIPGSYWIGHLAIVLQVSPELLAEEARMSRVKRREFLSLAALTAVHGKAAAEMVSTVAANDPGPLTSVQTTHGTDLVIAALSDRASTRRLHLWMSDSDKALLRVNAAGILAKLPGQQPAARVAQVLDDDEQTRRLYSTAVLSRVCVLDWKQAARIAADPYSTPPSKVRSIASRLAEEALNPRDAGARWCSAAVLRELSPILQ